MDERYLWPPRCRLAFYARRTRLLFSERDRQLDLSDTLMWDASRQHRTVYMGVSSRSSRWKRWTEANLKKIKSLIRYDIMFDGDRVRISRLSAKGSPCIKEFLWRLEIRTC